MSYKKDWSKVRKRIEELDAIIVPLQEEKAKLKRKLWFHEHYKYEKKGPNTDTLCYKEYGKHYKDLNEQERKEYNKMRTRERRAKLKEIK